MADGEMEDAATPRTLLSSVLLHEEPVNTLKRPALPISHVNENKLEGNQESEVMQLATPRTLISEVVSNNSPTKTLRVARVHGFRELQDQQQILEQPAVSVAGFEFERLPLKRMKKIKLSDIDLNKVLDASDKEVLLTELIPRDKLVSSSTLSHEPDVQKTDITIQNSTVNNRSSLSMQNSSHTETPSYASMQVSESVLLKRQVSNTDVTKGTLLDFNSVTVYDNSLNVSEHGDVHAGSGEPDKIVELSESRIDDEEVVPASEVDISSELGPLQLSKITEADPVGKEHSGISSPLQEHMSFDASQSKIPNGIYEDISQSREDRNAIPDATPSELKPQKVVVPSSRKHGNSGMNNYSDNLKVPPRRLKPKIKKKHDLPFSNSQLAGIVRHYASLKIPNDALAEFGRVSELYLKQTMEQLEEILAENGQKIISAATVESLLKCRGYINERNNLSILVEEYLPSEYREELVTVATAGNLVHPR